MQDFDIHVGRINASLKDYWGKLSVEFCTPSEREIRRIMVAATKGACNQAKQSVSVSDFVQTHSDIEYDSSSHQVCVGISWLPLDAWLLNFNCFSYDNRIYAWESDILLNSDDNEFDAFFALRCHTLDVMKLNLFLEYQLQRSMATSRKQYVAYLQRLLFAYPVLLPETPYKELISQYESNSTDNNEVADGESILLKPKRIDRTKQKDVTCLSKKQTLKLIYYLQQQKLIINEKNYLPANQLYAAWEVLTGYDRKSMSNDAQNVDLTKRELRELRGQLSSIISLIDNDLNTTKNG